MGNFIGSSSQDVLDGIIKRYAYGMRRSNDGELYLIRVDQLGGGAENLMTINEIGDAEENYPDFEEGIDFLDGIDENHNIIYDNLRYPQIKWDGRSLTYYIDPVDGQFILRISEGYDHDDTISPDGY